MENQTSFNKPRDFMKSNYGDEKLNKSTELNNTMSIENKSNDEYTKKLENLNSNGGKE